MFGSYAIITGPEAEPLTLDEAKRFARVESDHENALFEETLIPAARRYVEKACGLAIITQTWSATFDRWSDSGLKLTRAHPIATLEAVKVWNGTTLAEQDLGGFQLVTGRRPAVLHLADGGAVPIPSRSRAGIEITFTAGFGENGEAVPAELMLAMKQLVAHWYENREPTAVTQSLSVVGTIKHQVDALLRPWLALRLG